MDGTVRFLKVVLDVSRFDFLREHCVSTVIYWRAASDRKLTLRQRVCIKDEQRHLLLNTY